MNQTGMSTATLAVSKQSVTAGTIPDAEYSAIMNEFRSSLPADMVDPTPAALGASATASSCPSLLLPQLSAPSDALELPWPGCVPSTSPFHRRGSCERSRRRTRRHARWTCCLTTSSTNWLRTGLRSRGRELRRRAQADGRLLQRHRRRRTPQDLYSGAGAAQPQV
eukprot:4616299-Prymnesium_polylepis.4